jgi:RNA polymerase sigma-70 factor (ECF subfamily)
MKNMAHASVSLGIKRLSECGHLPVRSGDAGAYRNPNSDEELVELSLKGEEEAFRQLYERYQRLVYSVAFRILQDREEARDATQDIFILIYRSLGFWSPQRAKFSPWIHRMATNHAIDRWRSRRRRAELQMLDTSAHESKRLTYGPLSNETVLDQLDRCARIARIINGLPELQRRFVVLRYCEGLKLREIAEKEGCNLGAVKSTLHRATATMRSRINIANN